MKKTVLALFLMLYAFLNLEAQTQCANPHQGYENYCNGRNGTIDEWNYRLRECVSYVAWKKAYCDGVNDALISSWGDAFRWDNKAIREANQGTHIVVNRTPREGAIAQWNYGQNGTDDGSQYGHVAYVDDVNEDNQGNILDITISDYNWNNDNQYGTRILQASEFKHLQFIHINDYGASWSPMRIPFNLRANLYKGEATFSWDGVSPTQDLYAPWRLDIIKISPENIAQDDLDDANHWSARYCTEVSMEIPKGVESVHVRNGRLLWNYRSTYHNIRHYGTFYFEPNQLYQWRIFNGRYYYYGEPFQFSKNQMADELLVNTRLDGRMVLMARHLLQIKSGIDLSHYVDNGGERLNPYPTNIVFFCPQKIQVIGDAITIRTGISLRTSDLDEQDNNSRVLAAIAQTNMEVNDTPHKQVHPAIVIYPNPSSDVVNITFRLEEAGDVKVEILDAMGRKVWEHEAKKQEIGTQKIVWQGKNAERGLYFVHILANGKKEVRKVMLIN